ncbi:hypothetical protein D3C72_1413800 [compost metagenome]
MADHRGVGIGRNNQLSPGFGHLFNLLDVQDGASADKTPVADGFPDHADRVVRGGAIKRYLQKAEAAVQQNFGDGLSLLRRDATQNSDQGERLLLPLLEEDLWAHWAVPCSRGYS